MKLKFMIVFIIAACSVNVYSQPILKYKSTFTVTKESDSERLSKVQKIFNEEMQRAGAEYSENEGVMFLLGVSEENEDGFVALSISSLYSLPENIIQAGKYGQVFYLAIQTESIQQVSEEGNLVRDQISEEYMRQFFSIGSNTTIIVKKENLRKEINSFIKSFSF